jgi:phage terminase large subunit-like protein
VTSTSVPSADVPAVSLGWQIASWIEELLVHGPGDVQGDAIVLDPEFLGAIVEMYELVPETGRRRVNEFHLWAPKGRAKSELAGMLGVAEALGPVRFDHWAVKGESSWWGHEYEPGEPVGKAPTYPFIRCLATEEGQSGNTYANIHYMISEGVDRGYFTADAGLTRTFLSGGGEIRPSTASSASKDGGKETFAVFDETHLYTLPDLHRMFHTVRRNLVKRRGAEPWSLSTSTMYLPGEGSIAELIHNHAETVASGEIPDPGFRFRYFAGTDPADFDFDDDDELRSALGIAYGSASAWMDLDRIVSEIRSPLTAPEDAIRYFLNRPAGTAEDSVSVEVWKALEVQARLQDGDPLVVGFDGSQSDDATALVGIRPTDGVVFELGLWEKPLDARGKTWTVPRPEVDARVAEIFSRFRVVRFYADPPRWQPYIDRWIDAYGKETVFEWPSWSDKRIAAATDSFDALVRGAEIHHSQSGNLARHLGNARRSRVRGGWRPIKRSELRKIDLVLALMAAIAAWSDAVKRGEISASAKDPLSSIW